MTDRLRHSVLYANRLNDRAIAKDRKTAHYVSNNITYFMQINVEQLTVKVSFADLKNRSKHVFHFVSILRSTKFFISIRDILINNVITDLSYLVTNSTCTSL